MDKNRNGKLNESNVPSYGVLSLFLIGIALIVMMAMSVTGVSVQYSGCFNASVSGNFSLSATATTNATNCINVTASDVLIDCAGNTINYGHVNQSEIVHGINVSGSGLTNITITGCSINDSRVNGSNSYGIYIDGGVNVTNSDITTFGNASVHGIYVDTTDSRSVNITNVSITVQGVTTSNGIHVASAPLVMLNSNNITTNATDSYAMFFTGAINASGSHNKFTNPTAWINVSTLDGNVSLTNTTYARGANTGNIRMNTTILFNDTNTIGNSVINISVNRSFVDSANYPVLNVSARVTLQGLTMFTNPDEILNDGVSRQCPVGICTQVSFVNGTYVFDVTQWTVYSINEINIVQGTSTPGPTKGGGGGGGGGSYDPRYASARGLVEAQYGQSYFDPSDLGAGEEASEPASTTPVTPARTETSTAEDIGSAVDESTSDVSESGAVADEAEAVDSTAEEEPSVADQKVTKSGKTWLWGLILLVVIIIAGFLYYRNKNK